MAAMPSLVSYCQRVLSAHADALTALGDDIRYDVIRPVLECCSADTLLRLEQSSPYLEQDTSDLWEHLCFKSYPLLVLNIDEPPESWRDQYFLLRAAEAHRLEEVASKLRNQRIEEAERKRGREVKLTDKLPPTKRTRAWGAPYQPKSLFQKTKNEATKLRRSLYAPPSAPRARVPRPTTVTPLVPSSIIRQTNAKPIRPSALAISPPRPVQSTSSIDLVSNRSSKSQLPAHPQSQASDPPRTSPSKPPIQKRDPMASLFMPKHRALSQLPSQTGNNNRTVPAR